jgi:hypothetical protein
MNNGTQVNTSPDQEVNLILMKIKSNLNKNLQEAKRKRDMQKKLNNQLKLLLNS